MARVIRDRMASKKIGTPCRSCGETLTPSSHSYTHPGSCKPCSAPLWKSIVQRSIAKRIAANAGKLCRECGVNVLTVENQSKSSPGSCRSCSNKRAIIINKASRVRRLSEVVGKHCKTCRIVELTPQTISRVLIGSCKGCASEQQAERRNLRLDQVENTECRTCSKKLTPETMSASSVGLCKPCHNKKHSLHISKSRQRFLDKPCHSCQKTILTEYTQAATSPKFCKSCVNVKVETAFNLYIGSPCSKCGVELDLDNQSKAHLGKCKPCRNSELICSSCGNKGGVYRGKLCGACVKTGRKNEHNHTH